MSIAALSFTRRRVVGIAIGPSTLVAAGHDHDTSVWSRPLLPFDGATSWAALEEALRALRAVRPAAGALAIALLPPLVQVRPVQLPPLSLDEARHVLRRNAARYFVAVREPQVVGLTPVSTRTTETPPLMAAAAPARLVEAVYAAAEAAGWEVRTVVPAQTAWQAASRAAWPELGRGSHDIVILRSDGTEVLHLENGAIAAIRRFGDLTADLAPLRAALARPSLSAPVGASAATASVALVGPAPLRETLAAGLFGAGRQVLVPAGEHGPLADIPEVVAAAAVADIARGSPLALVPESARLRRDERRSKAAATMAAVAVALLVVTAVVQLWGLRRALDQVRREREALRPRVASLIATRDSAAFTDQRLQELVVAQQSSVPWSEVLVTVTSVLPKDAHLTEFRAEGDSMVMNGLTARAAQTFAALEAIPKLANVRSAAPVQHELGDRTRADAPERFSVAARYVPDTDSTGLALGATARRP